MGTTACGQRMAHRKWKEIKQQPGTAGPDNMLGCCLISFHFLLAILCPQAVETLERTAHEHLVLIVLHMGNLEIDSGKFNFGYVSSFHLFLSPWMRI